MRPPSLASTRKTKLLLHAGSGGRPLWTSAAQPRVSLVLDATADSFAGHLPHCDSLQSSRIVNWLARGLRLLSSLPGGLFVNGVRGSLLFLFDLLSSFFLKSRFPLGIFFPPGPAVRNRQVIMPGWVSRL